MRLDDYLVSSAVYVFFILLECNFFVWRFKSHRHVNAYKEAIQHYKQEISPIPKHGSPSARSATYLAAPSIDKIVELQPGNKFATEIRPKYAGSQPAAVNTSPAL